MRRSSMFLLPLVFAAASARAEGESPKNPVPASAPAAAAAQDVVTLKDGRRLEGRIVGEDDRYVSFESGGVTRAYAKDTVTSIERAPRSPAVAQPAAPAPEPGSPSEKAPNDKKGKGERKDAPLSDTARKWLDDLVAKTADPDETVRRSAAAAIRELGPQTVPALRAAAAALPDGPQKEFLGRLAGEIESSRERRMRGEGGPGGRRGAEEVLQRLSAQLELTDAQRPKVHEILEDWGRRRGEVFRDARREGLSKEQVDEKVAALRTDVTAKMKSVLTEPQYATFEDMAARLFAAAPSMPKPEGGPPPAPPAPGQPK